MEKTCESKSHPWKTDNWFVSPWNYVKEVIEDFKPPNQVKIHDITLRDGEQQAGIIFTKDDKVRIAEKLAEVGSIGLRRGCLLCPPRTKPLSRRL